MAIHFDFIGRLSFVNSVIPVIEYTIIQTLFIPGLYDCYCIFLLLLIYHDPPPPTHPSCHTKATCTAAWPELYDTDLKLTECTQVCQTVLTRR